MCRPRKLYVSIIVHALVPRAEFPKLEDLAVQAVFGINILNVPQLHLGKSVVTGNFNNFTDLLKGIFGGNQWQTSGNIH